MPLEAIMSKIASSALTDMLYSVPFVLLVITALEPTIWEPAWELMRETRDALVVHAQRLGDELTWRLMNGAM